ncbi:protein-arginine deiminase type-2 isoform X1 [Nerophis ophidion]|uniref:protein-arginine deiminase type-2 isoform X1 n=1 Tax=Nerophis ophidion TaxID=159077 RepID=UPI002ADF0EF1|nr:protein-arginine deiminase type-2 isoform X1 [Nerophis ophidion]XP_061741777.1 protein-arginine deiminase type-2 isoform X1 [Nerophis ophidion]
MSEQTSPGYHFHRKTNDWPEYQRTIRMDTESAQKILYVEGTTLKANLGRCAPPKSKFFSVKCTPTIKYSVVPPPQDTPPGSPLVLEDKSTLLISMTAASQHQDDSKLSVSYYGQDEDILGTSVLQLTALEISLDVDADRDGIVEENNPNKGSWKWGPDGHGAILLVNCDAERSYVDKPDHMVDYIVKLSDLKDMSVMALRTRGPAKLPEGYKLTMHTCQDHAEGLRVYMSKPRYGRNSLSDAARDYTQVLSSHVLSREVPYLGGEAEMNFYVEGLMFPDKDFDGLVRISLSLLEPIRPGLPEMPIFTDTVTFRVAPWIMTPNILEPAEVFVCSTSDNYAFLKGMRSLVAKSGYKLSVCHAYMNRGDRWMQDELEFGYIEAPHQRFPVVLDSPRDGELLDFPYKELLGPDFGHVTRVAPRGDVSSLDSFGNLEVSPPVTVDGKEYPLGRIIIGVAFPTTTQGRHMTKVVQDFLWAQKVQEPIALYSDWLVVGHVDEFMTFVPAPDRKGFRLLLASPDAGYKLFRVLKNQGHGQAKIFEGCRNQEPITVDDILEDTVFQADNNYVQSCIDWNRDVLKRELGLEDSDIIDLPILFKLQEDEGDVYRAVAFYPDMVNLIVLGKNLGIPKPFGPKVDGRCALEAEMCSLMEDLGLSCTFIDDFASYHRLLGEVHCGSNVRREPFHFKWWNLDM